MDLKGLIEHYEQRATKWHNDIKYKKMCHTDTSVMENALQLLETIISDMRAVAKTNNDNSALPIPDVSGSACHYCGKSNFITINGSKMCNTEGCEAAS
jgi:hypothetical protein